MSGEVLNRARAFIREYPHHDVALHTAGQPAGDLRDHAKPQHDMQL
jgi:hypothetical protein